MTNPKKMKAVVIKEHGGPEQLVLAEMDVPKPAFGDVLIRVKAFGINRAETYMRKGAWGNVAPVSGIECVGEVAQDTTGAFPEGAKVAAMMGGLGRTRNGSYAEYTCAPATNVVPLKSSLSWADLAAIPESYATAWCCLFDSHHLQPGQVLLVRGATSALGQAAVNIAADAGAVVLGTTRSQEKTSLVRSLGAKQVLIEGKELAPVIRELYPDGIDCVLDLIGTRTMQDSLKMVKKGGRVVIAGFLGGRESIQFEVLAALQTGPDLSFFASFALGSKDYPISAIPLQTMVQTAEKGIYQTRPAKVFNLEELPEAHRLMEANQANGKIVVVI
ncbi:MAG TPA: zinc-binding dehydrogenase [Verrucomicrobiae bacterium]|nr:zinc-binding dehydrogenase [Verrucomicrobiae bacterium]